MVPCLRITFALPYETYCEFVTIFIGRIRVRFCVVNVHVHNRYTYYYFLFSSIKVLIGTNLI